MHEIPIAVEMTFSSDQPATDEQFEAFLDKVVEELGSIEREVNLGARLRDRVADFATVVEASDFASATAAFMIDLRTALHAAGCNTASFPRFTPSEQVVRELLDA